MPTLVLILGSLYCLIPVVWVVIAASKGRGELFSTFTFAPGTGFLDNLKQLSSYRDGIYWQWMVNSLFYAGGGAPPLRRGLGRKAATRSADSLSGDGSSSSS